MTKKIKIEQIYNTVEEYNVASDGKPAPERPIRSLEKIIQGELKIRTERDYDRCIIMVDDVVVVEGIVHLQTKPFKGCDGEMVIKRLYSIPKKDLVSMVATYYKLKKED